MAKKPISNATEGEMPEWFDLAQHVVTQAGIMAKGTGILLDGDGEPQSGPHRNGSHAGLVKAADEAALPPAELADPEAQIQE